MAPKRAPHQKKRRHDPSQWYFQLFKEYDQVDIDMLLPGCKVLFSAWDYFNVGVPLAIGVGVAIYKLATATLVFDQLSAAASSLAMIFAPITYGLNAYWNFKKREEDYRNELNNILLLKSIGSNGSVLTSLLAEAQEQEDLEAILAYFFLWNGEDSPRPILKRHLDLKVEVFLNDLLGLPKTRINFQVGDAVQKLKRMNILSLQRTPDGPLLRVLSLEDAVTQLPPWDPYGHPPNQSRASAASPAPPADSSRPLEAPRSPTGGAEEREKGESPSPTADADATNGEQPDSGEQTPSWRKRNIAKWGAVLRGRGPTSSTSEELSENENESERWHSEGGEEEEGEYQEAWDTLLSAETVAL